MLEGEVPPRSNQRRGRRVGVVAGHLPTGTVIDAQPSTASNKDKEASIKEKVNLNAKRRWGGLMAAITVTSSSIHGVRNTLVQQHLEPFIADKDRQSIQITNETFSRARSAKDEMTDMRKDMVSEAKQLKLATIVQEARTNVQDGQDTVLSHFVCFDRLDDSHPLRIWCLTTVRSNIFNWIVFLTVIGYSTVLARSYLYSDSVLLWTDVLTLTIFTFEAVMKCLAYGFRRGYWRSPWNKLDFIVLVFWYLELMFPQIASVAVTFRALRPLKGMTRAKGAKVLSTALIKSVYALGDVFLLLMFLVLMYGAVGVQLFSGNRTDPESLNNPRYPLIRPLGLQLHGSGQRDRVRYRAGLSHPRPSSNHPSHHIT